MTDRELLELTAKAAGYGYQWSEDARMFVSGIPGIGWKEWNPLSSDGDAFRLAVRLNLQVTPGTYWPNAVSVFRAAYAEAIERDCTDMYAATRRAIVRAAAEIGRNMP